MARTLVMAAGGNGTAVEIIEKVLSREEYELRGAALLDDFTSLGAEQAGFLVLPDKHFEMAGGEFCGNATRAAAVLLYLDNKNDRQSFTVSGFNGAVTALVKPLGDTTYFVEANFPEMRVTVEDVLLEDGLPAKIVDLGGIVHVTIEGIFPSDPEEYSRQHRRIVDQFGLGQRDAVGVVWYQKQPDGVVMHPVVWVRSVDTFYYETSCGSGAIAVAKATGATSITQPTDKAILVDIGKDTVTLKSEMKIVS